MNIKHLLICPALFLAACGGGQTAFEAVPISASGFATTQDSRSRLEVARLTDLTRVVATDPNARSFQAQDLTVIRLDDDTIEIVLGTETYRLVRPDPDRARFEFVDGEDFAYFSQYLSTDYAAGVEIITWFDEVSNRGNVVLGYDTDPATVVRKTGGATYEGRILATLSNGNDDAFGSGDVSFNVDFDRNKISGSAEIVDDDFEVNEFNFDPVSIILSETDINENAFKGSIESNDPDLNGFLVDAEYQGHFFGPDVEDVGGQMTGRIDVNNVELDTFVDAMFIGTK